MIQYKLFTNLIPIAFIILSGCIEQYYPDDDMLKTGTLVVQAHLNNKPGEQSVVISRSSSLIYPEFDPLSGCFVEVLNTDGDSREFRESKPGIYVFIHNDEFLRNNEEYRLIFLTPGGKRYESEFEKIHPAPEINSIYYILENHSTSDPDEIEEGVQIYMDFEIEKNSGRYLRWQVTETYEIHNPESEAWIFDKDRRLKLLPDSSSWRTCWITLDVPEIFTLDLRHVEGETYKKMPLNYVNTETRRLNIRYSILVEQMALSQSAFHYWQEQAKNSQSGGSLFDSQPSLSPGNICNMDDENELVIGFFSVSGVTERRVFIEDVPGLKTQKDLNYCMPGEYPKFLSRFHVEYLPVYLAIAWVDGSRSYGEVHKYCVDCRDYKGSSHIKPDYW
jgi:hypothetical protein